MADGGIGEAALLDAAFDTAAFEGLTAAEAATPAATSIAGAGAAGAGAAGAANVFDPYAFEGIGQYMAQAPINPVTQAVNAGNIANVTGSAPGAFQGITELNAAQTADLMRNIDPRMVDSLAPTNAVSSSALDTTAGPFNPPSTPFAGTETPDLIPGAYGTSTPSSFLNQASAFAKEYKNPLMMAGTSLGLRALMSADRNRYGVPGTEKYTGPLSKFSYNPSNYRPDIPTPPANPYRAQYAAGGPVETMSNQATLGANTMYPMANMTTSAFATPYQDPKSTNMMQSMAPAGGGTVNMMSGEPNMQGTRLAEGGQIRHFGFGGFLGDSISDIGSQLGHMFKGGGDNFGNVGPMLESAQGPSKYDPATQKYVPDNAQPMAEGGITRLASGGFFKNVLGDAAQLVGDIGGGAVNLVSNLGQGRVSLGEPDHGTYQPYDDYSKNSYTYNPEKYKTYTAPNPNTYQAQYAGGGIAQLAVGGKLLRGQGDGMSDSIKANISGKREARLADGEFVVPADVVSHLGNGSTDAGAKQLYSMMDKVRQARVGTKKQGKQINPMKYMPA